MRMLRFLLSLTIVFAPLYILRGIIPLPFSNIGLPTTFLELLIICCFILLITELINEKKSLKGIRTKFDFLIILFLVNGLVSVFIGPDWFGGFGIFRAYFLEPVIFYYILSYELSKSGNYKFILNSLILSGFWISLLGLLQKLTGSFTLAPHEISQGRISAVYNSANALALYLGPITSFTLMFFIKSIKKLKLLYLFILGFMILTIYWTKSRGGLVAEVLSIVIFVYVYLSSINGKILFLRSSQLRKYWYIPLIGIILSITFFFYQVYAIYSIYPPDVASHVVRGDTLHIRYLIWNSTFKMLRDNPIFGSGLEGFKQSYISIYKPTIYPEDFQYPHNLFLTFWTETGLIGLLIFGAIIYKSYIYILKNIRKKYDNVLAAALLGAMSYNLIHGMVDVPYFKNDLSLLFWVILALVNYWTVKASSAPSARS